MDLTRRAFVKLAAQASTVAAVTLSAPGKAFSFIGKKCYETQLSDEERMVALGYKQIWLYISTLSDDEALTKEEISGVTRDIKDAIEEMQATMLTDMTYHRYVGRIWRGAYHCWLGKTWIKE